VFGVSSDEYLNYATKNRQEWEARGQEVVDEMIEKVNQLWSEKEAREETAEGKVNKQDQSSPTMSEQAPVRQAPVSLFSDAGSLGEKPKKGFGRRLSLRR
jgi:hypothetical protein